MTDPVEIARTAGIVLSIIGLLLCFIALSLRRIARSLERLEKRGSVELRLPDELPPSLHHGLMDAAWHAGRNFRNER